MWGVGRGARLTTGQGPVEGAVPLPRIFFLILKVKWRVLVHSGHFCLQFSCLFYTQNTGKLTVAIGLQLTVAMGLENLQQLHAVHCRRTEEQKAKYACWQLYRVKLNLYGIGSKTMS